MAIKSGDSRMRVVTQSLGQARSAWRAIDVGSSVLRGMTFLLLALLAGFVADNVFDLPGAVRLAYAVLFLGGVVYIIVFHIAFRMVRPLSDEMVARHVEKKYPELDNRLINAVLLHKERIADPVTRTMVASQLDDTASAVRRCDMVGSTDSKPLWRWGKWAVALGIFAVIYGMAFSRHFTNAVKRFAAPTKYIAPLTDTQLTVTPGNAERLEGEMLTILAEVKGVLPETARVYFDDGESDTVHRPMPFEGSHFVYEFSNLQKGFGYWVKAGDATSRKFEVTVLSRPNVSGIKLAYDYPDYTNLESKTEDSETGSINAVTGTKVTVDITADRPLKKAHLSVTYLVPNEKTGAPQSVELPMELSPQGAAKAEIDVDRCGHYRIHIEDAAGIPNQPIARQIVALPDEPPMVKVLEPSKDVTATPDSKVPVLAEAKDDFSLRGLKLLMQSRGDDDWKEFRSWEFPPGSQEKREGCTIILADLQVGPGDIISYFFRGDDGRPDRDETAGTSRIYQISVVSKDVAQEEDQKEKEALRTLLTKLIGMQRANLAATQRLGRWDEANRGDIGNDKDARKDFDIEAAALLKTEGDIYSTATKGVRELAGDENAESLSVLADIAASEITRAVTQLNMMKKAAGNNDILPVAEEAAVTEKAIVAALEKLLTNPRTALAERLEEAGKKEDVSDAPEDLMNAEEMAEQMKERLEEFHKEQAEVMAMTKQLADINADDLTEEDEMKFEELAETELKWGKYFKEKATDLSKLPPQSAELASMAKECLEVWTDLEAAADALKKKATEIATAMEESSNGQAQEITENIEKWLPEGRDSETWKMEGLDNEADQALAPLPEELEDLIGELLDKEDELMEDADDASSDSLSSMDKGIGWDAMDGPMASMSAKGVTGNRLPNANEMGGRAGEGRSGKSTGQFVEEEAHGKGGRTTPTRKTPTPFEAGVVKDYEAEPGTGATGGGKESGAGQEGLQGQIPPATRGKMKRLASMQQNLIDKAQRVDMALKEYNYPRGDLPKTIELMEEVQQDLDSGAYISTAGKRNRNVLTGLREVKDMVEKQKELSRDRAPLLPKELREEIASSQHEKVPREYEDMVDNYFRALSEAGTR